MVSKVVLNTPSLPCRTHGGWLTSFVRIGYGPRARALFSAAAAFLFAWTARRTPITFAPSAARSSLRIIAAVVGRSCIPGGHKRWDSENRLGNLVGVGCVALYCGLYW